MYWGIVEADKTYAAVCSYKKLNRKYVDAKVLFYVFDKNEVYNAPIGVCYLDGKDGNGIRPLHARWAFVNLGRAIASGGLDVYAIRDAYLKVSDLNSGKYMGEIHIDGEKVPL